ncbi:hypothetical protein C8Q75DRAFT_20866 [Abortiporus biennis]|nr:hypothetical protein C8Q75DRAFT_20866 [Abortiporus biennis]
MTSSTSPRLLSPTSSFDYISSIVHSREHSSDSSDSYTSLSSDVSSDEDEIVWSFSDISAISGSPSLRSQRPLSPATFSDEDVIVVSRPRSRAHRFQSLTVEGSGENNMEALSQTLATLQIKTSNKHSKKASRSANAAATASTTSSPSKKRSKKRKSATNGAAVTSTTSTAEAQVVSAPSSPKKKRGKRKSPALAPAALADDADGLGERPIVDDISEAGDDKTVVSGYEEARQYVTSVLSDPASKTASNLTLLQALIIELGLCPAAAAQETLPRTLRSAKAFLKSRVFLNVRDYLAVRHQGLDALRGVMHPSRSSLVKDIRAKSDRKMPRDVVKKSGLGVLLVTCYR